MAAQAPQSENATGNAISTKQSQHSLGEITPKTKFSTVDISASQQLAMEKVNLDPNNQPTNSENDWQTVPILRQHRGRYNKRRRMSETPSPEIPIPVQNRYSQLQLEDEPSTQKVTPKAAVSKPPPIMLYGVTDITKLKETVDSVLDKTQYTFKIVTKNQLRVSCNSIDSYKKLITLAREKELIGHTFTSKDERPFRIVIKNLHPSTPTEAIQEAVESTGNKVKGEIINARHGPSKIPSHTWFVNLEPGPNNCEVKKLKYIYHTSVKIEDPKRQTTIAQCKRCQQYGHTKNYCMRPYRCVKCAEGHSTSDCPKKDRNTPAKCALCLGEHTANYKGCTVFLEIQKRKFGSNKRPPSTQNKEFKEQGEWPKLPTKSTQKQTDPQEPPAHENSFWKPSCAHPTLGIPVELQKILSKNAEKLDRLIDQMGAMMTLLTTIVNKLVH